MITEAHIGIGISGLEGQQAARAADYSIGQFRFLRNLLLAHGRENYRRNTFLIAYMFYKNIMYVWPVWFFGFFSLFSAQAIYDVLLYQLYNIAYTGLPIIIYAVFDWEHSKQELMNRPKLYKIGLEDIYFNKYVFWRWFFYAVWQGTLLLLLAFYTIDGAMSDDGETGSLYVDANMVFGTIVIVVNMKVLISSRQWHFWNILVISLSAASFFLSFWALSLISSYYLYGVFNHLYQFSETYLTMVYFIFAFILIDSGITSIDWEVRRIRQLRIELDDQMRKELNSKTKIAIKTKFVPFKNTGFAYASEPGNDSLVTAPLSMRLKEAFASKIFKGMNYGTASSQRMSKEIQDFPTPESQVISTAPIQRIESKDFGEQTSGVMESDKLRESQLDEDAFKSHNNSNTIQITAEDDIDYKPQTME